MPIREGLELSEEDAVEYDRLIQESLYNDRLQYIFKIKLNSFYGGISNAFFRFYDNRIGESTTGTGRMILRHQCRKVNEILGGEYNVDFPLALTEEDALESGNSTSTALYGPIFNGEYHSDAVLYGDSVTGDTKIDVLGEQIEIENLFRSVDHIDHLSNKEYHHPTDLFVACYDELDMSIQQRQVKYIMRHKTNKQIYRVHDACGNSVDVTEDHSMLVVKRNRNHYWKLCEIRPQELIGLDCRHENYMVVKKNEKDFAFVEATKIEKISYEGYVYDIEVEELHNFFANNILVHNTDSTYFKTYAHNKEEAIEVADYVGQKVNESFPEFMREMFLCTPGFDDKIQSAREIVSQRGIFVDKKRYVLNVVDKEGKAKDEIKAMGVELVKTTLPKAIGKKLTKFLEQYLKGMSWEELSKEIVSYKDELSQPTNLITIGLPKGISKLEHYTGEYQRLGVKAKLPGHVAASIFYNIKREEFEDRESPHITSGMKVKVFYLKNKIGKFKSIALPGDLTSPPDWFSNFDIDISAHIERLVDNPLNNIIKAINKTTPSHQSMLIDDLLEF